jgi:hypothetical protein
MGNMPQMMDGMDNTSQTWDGMDNRPQMWGGMNDNMPEMGCPIVEPAITKCIQRDFCHQVPHVCPVHTHVVNRHIYNHTYTPQYSCSEENQCVNIGDTGCCGF